MNLLSPSFGIFFWQLLAVVCVVFILKKFFFKVIFNVLETRENTIKESIENAKKIELELQNIEILKRKNVEEIENKKIQTFKEIEEMRNSLILEAKKNAEELKNRLLDEAKKDIETQKKRVKDQYNAELAKLAIAISEKLLKKELSSENKQELFLNTVVNECTKLNSKY